MPEIILGHFADQRGLSIFNLLCKASSLFENLIGKSILLTHKKQYCGNTLVVFKKKSTTTSRKSVKTARPPKCLWNMYYVTYVGFLILKLGGIFYLDWWFGFTMKVLAGKEIWSNLYTAMNFLFCLNCN